MGDSYPICYELADSVVTLIQLQLESFKRLATYVTQTHNP